MIEFRIHTALILIFLVHAILEFAVYIRRLHDIGLSGWIYLIIFVASVVLAHILKSNSIYLIFFIGFIIGVVPSRPPNKWGQGPWRPNEAG